MSTVLLEQTKRELNLLGESKKSLELDLKNEKEFLAVKVREDY